MSTTLERPAQPIADPVALVPKAPSTTAETSHNFGSLADMSLCPEKNTNADLSDEFVGLVCPDKKQRRQDSPISVLDRFGLTPSK